ncbi:MAG: hypothetical protein Fur002_11440 [Anaerolineales bacterium]
MEKRQVGLIATIATTVLCGCPGLFMCFFGGVSVLASMMPNAEIDVLGSSDPAAATTMGVVFLCLSLIFIAIPIAVWFFTLRKRPEAALPNEPLPPVS